MRIDSNQGAQRLLENSLGANQSPNRASSAGSSVSGDQAELSGVHLQIQALVAQAAQLPEVRQEKVNALRQAVASGNYRPSPEQVSEALFAALVRTAA
jgi:negative regulator of flagellin synthesis FlgM